MDVFSKSVYARNMDIESNGEKVEPARAAPQETGDSPVGRQPTEEGASGDVRMEIPDSIQIDPPIEEPKLDDPLMTSVKIGRNDVDDRSPERETTGNAAVRHHQVPCDPIETFFHRSRDRCIFRVQIIQTVVHGFLKKRKQLIKRVLLVAALLGYILYFCFAVWYNTSGAMILIILTSLVVFTVTHKFVMKRWGTLIREKCVHPIGKILGSRQCRYFRW